MLRFKIIQDDHVVGVGSYFLRWYDRTGNVDYSDINRAMLIMDEVTGNAYHCSWLYPVPPEANRTFPEAEVTEIDETEYDELFEQLKDGEEIAVPVETPEPVFEEETNEQPEPQEPRMTVRQMRERIMIQDELIQILTDCVLEMSEIVYGG